MAESTQRIHYTGHCLGPGTFLMVVVVHVMILILPGCKAHETYDLQDSRLLRRMSVNGLVLKVERFLRILFLGAQKSIRAS